MNIKKIDRKNTLLQKRRWRIRRKVAGTPERPRLNVRFTNRHIHAQIIDDEAGRTLVATSSLAREVREESLHSNREGATRLGKLLAEKARSNGIERVVFDRNGRRYHGSVQAFADAAREGGLIF